MSYDPIADQIDRYLDDLTDPLTEDLSAYMPWTGPVTRLQWGDGKWVMHFARLGTGRHGRAEIWPEQTSHNEWFSVWRYARDENLIEESRPVQLSDGKGGYTTTTYIELSRPIDFEELATKEKDPADDWLDYADMMSDEDRLVHYV